MAGNASQDVTDLLRQQSVLARFGASALRSENLDEILTEACRLVGEALGTELAKVMELQPDGITLVVRSGVGWKAGVVGEATVRAEQGSSEGYALQTGEAVASDDIDTETRFTYADFLKDNGVKALVNVIIMGAEGKPPFGILEVDSRTPRRFTDDDISFLQTYANFLATAVERLRTLHEMRAILLDREQRAFEAREQDMRRRIAVEVGEVGLWELDIVSGELTWDDRVRAAFGVHDGRPLVQSEKLAAVHRDDRQEFERRFKDATDRSSEFAMQFRTVGVDDGLQRWVFVQGRVLRDEKGRPVRFLGALRDVSDRVASDERRILLNQELAHRLKNTLAVVQSIVTQTLRTAPDLESGRKSLVQRIQALARAHDILLSGQRDAGTVDAIVKAAVSLHDPDGRIAVDGPDLALGPKAALTLALIMHELSTNAAKYGALSVEEGTVGASWTVDGASDKNGPLLDLIWTERNGPAALPPARKGFGTRLIEMGLSGSPAGFVELDYAETGLSCRIVAPLLELQRDGEPRE